MIKYQHIHYTIHIHITIHSAVECKRALLLILPHSPQRDNPLQGLISNHIYLTIQLPPYNHILSHYHPYNQLFPAITRPPSHASSPCLPLPAGRSQNFKGILMEKVLSWPIFIKLISLPSSTHMQESPNYKLSDSLPTNHSDIASSLFPAGPALSSKCLPLHAEWMRSCWAEKAEGILQWLKARGVKAGEPEELLSQHRSEQKKNIIQRMGRTEGKGKRGLPSLITRRLKSKASFES